MTPLKQALPLHPLPDLQLLPTHIKVNEIRLLSALHTFLEWKREGTGVVPELPEIGFGARETGTVDAQLLTGADDEGAVVGVGDAVGLGVL
ncbi:hypothetical protein DXG01_011346 [Tephrocybe rancida]|nr:hypothetical protein DXG01_011346 [Tephrocybe rancida]